MVSAVVVVVLLSTTTTSRLILSPMLLRPYPSATDSNTKYAAISRDNSVTLSFCDQVKSIGIIVDGDGEATAVHSKESEPAPAEAAEVTEDTPSAPQVPKGFVINIATLFRHGTVLYLLLFGC